MEDMTQFEQIQVMRNTDVAIGMHGAGMVNVGFLKPDVSRVVEIFPRNKRRWGYRNLCYYLNIRYSDYRAGKDRGPHKHIDLTDWAIFIRNFVAQK